MELSFGWAMLFIGIGGMWGFAICAMTLGEHMWIRPVDRTLHEMLARDDEREEPWKSK